MNLSRPLAFTRRHPVATACAAVLLALALLLALFDWDWLRGPLERYVSSKSGRTFRISHLDVKLGLTPTIRLRDVYVGNAPWSAESTMARIPAVEFSVSLRDLPGKILVPRVALTEPDLLLERSSDDRRNWVLSDPSGQSPSRLRIGTLSVDRGRLRFLDHGMPFDIDIHASTFDAASQARTKDAGAKPQNDRYTTQYAFSGSYHGARFSGSALTGEVLSFQESGVPFPLKGDLVAGNTHLQVEGTIADAAHISAIDARLRIEGRTLANLYPFLLLPLPASPPYQLQGRLILQGNRYAMDDLVGKIGSTDVHGRAAYVNQKPRPLLTADLHSSLLDISDLGPLVGVQTRASGGKPAVSQADTRSRATAQAREKATDPNHILPAGTFDGSRLQKIDAEVDLEAQRLKAPTGLPLESLRASLRLHDAVLKLAPLDFGFAGGTIASQVTLDAREPLLKSELQVDFRRIRVDRLVPDKAALAQGAGTLGASIALKGTGDSIADAAAKANGHLSAAIARGRISNLLDAASGLNGGKVLQLLASGDRTIDVNCGGVAFDVRNGRGTATLFVVDTEQTQILGSGGFDLAQERFDLVITPRPKHMGILSLRTPVHVLGSFKQPRFEIEKAPLLARAGGALALAAAAPLAALLPLIETGPGESTNCALVQRKAGLAEKQAVAPARK